MDNSKVKNNLAFMRDIHTSSLQKRKERLRNINKREVDFVCDCAFNILRKNLPLTHDQIKGLRQPTVKKVVYTLANKSVPYERRRDIIKQSGGFLPLLLAPLLGSILGNVISNIVPSN